ncbi:MAG TPA: hypothetical protein VH301_14525 [Usitatibacter sp.]|nr:hypothetical protein [Usitatibacter sp.]
MQPLIESDWQKVLWKIVRNPAFEVVAAIVVVILAAWIVIEGETEHRHTLFPVPVLAK